MGLILFGIIGRKVDGHVLANEERVEKHSFSALTCSRKRAELIEGPGHSPQAVEPRGDRSIDVKLTWVGGIAAVLSLCLNLYAKEYKIQNEVSQHRNAANVLWVIREEYVSLLVDFEVLEDSEIQKKRDVLCNKVSEVNNNYPATDKKSYRAAQKALQKEEEQTFKENEVDSILPNGIDKY